MSRPLLAFILAVFATSLPSAAAGAPGETLQAVVGPGFNIALQHADSTAVTHLDPGTYTINVDDRGDLHNFHLSGPGVDQRTAVETIETASWTVTFVDGRYKFLCDLHPVQMKGAFTVGNVPAVVPVPRLTGKVTARAISLKTATGARARTLLEGTYRIAVNDASKTQNFHLQGPGVNRKTKVARTGTVTWNVLLRPGAYTYRSDKSRKLRGSFTVKSGPLPA